MEFLFDLAAEGVGAASRSAAVPKPVRIALIVLIVLFYVAAIGLIFLADVLLLGDGRPAAASVMFLIGVLLTVISIRAFRTTYLKRKK